MARTETPVRERIAKLKTWRDHSDWSAGKAAKELNVLKPTLLSWKKTYWHKLDTYEPGDAKREKGGGRKHRMETGTTVTTTYNYVTKPRQANVVDCAVYALHYMHAVMKFIIKHRPESLLEHMPSLTTSTFNVKKASASRAKILSTLASLQAQ
ncbi:uncharacterized protein PITG_03914 [Phytophthora infestans T30-4]|uniref:Ubiquitin-like protease family profile domain-containing protein n=1 Tax=Phytophthora infestans (strain T30-4) TaxID=403677 RepID=D0MYV1_PHYIT|nr:uncharacterized protein PITG_03914 [Phytophthora infestans T30-4]EEY66349.1 hypothetical protein PITG_03914 [Phytophthora infestans T30-4]|eukprot:XP_002906948.1 hypothetical protein PITG_03914 [Phytophthora infestans T30-4]